MVNLVYAPFGREIKDVDKNTFVKETSPYVNAEVLEWMLKDEENVEVTYNPDSKVCRFDFVDIESILKRNIPINYIVDEEDNEFINIDVDFEKNKMIFYIALNNLEYLLEDLSEEEKIKLISKYKMLKDELNKIKFYLEVDEELGTCLVTNNLKGLTVDGISEAINTVENFRTNL